MSHSRLLVDSLEPRTLMSADLAVAYAGRIPAAIPVTGKSHVTVALTNRGDAIASGPATVQLYASPTQSLDPGAMLLGSDNRVLKLGVGRKTAFTISFSSPTSLPTGSYYLLAAVIPGFVDSNSDNDTAISKPVNIAQPFVDLTDSVAMTPAKPVYTVGAKGQKPIRFTLTLHDAGNITAKGLVDMALFGYSTLDGSTVELQTFGFKRVNLGAGKSVKFLFTWKPTSATQSGVFYGRLQVNSNQGVTETDYTNDTAATSSTFTINNSLKPVVSG